MRAALLAATFLLAACEDSSNMCWPTAAATMTGDASTDGCMPRNEFDVCEVQPDGSQNCKNQCSSSQYALICQNARPADALRCSAIPVPTPLGAAFYCCPCAH
jgi:hypothetical protein